MTSWQQHDTRYQSMDNGTRPCKYFGSFGEVDGKDVESEEDIGWIADVCDDLAENMDSGTVVCISRIGHPQVAHVVSRTALLLDRENPSSNDP